MVLQPRWLRFLLQASLMPKGFFVTGTDTDVGKTVLSSLLCAALPAVYWKPIQTGAREGTDRQTIARLLGDGAGAVAPETYLFDDPVSPHLAAQSSGMEICIGKIAVPRLDSALPLVVEGAGGVMVPINRSQFMTDLMLHLALPVVLAARSTLGTINHTLLSLQCLESAGIQTRGVVLIGPENPENRAAIEHYGRTRVIGHIPMLPEINKQSLLDVYARTFLQEAFT
jgi:dethiobiotin synthase